MKNKNLIVNGLIAFFEDCNDQELMGHREHTYLLSSSFLLSMCSLDLCLTIFGELSFMLAANILQITLVIVIFILLKCDLSQAFELIYVILFAVYQLGGVRIIDFVFHEEDIPSFVL